jgi:D-3-phosphoglycerate dehydrogenase
MKKVLVTDTLSKEGLKILEECKSISVDTPYGISQDELIKIIPNYDALIVRSQTKVTKEVIENAVRLSIIGRAGTGYDNIDVQAATKKGIIVMNVPGGNTIAAAECTLALMLAAARNIPQAMASLKSGKWDRRSFVGVELFQKILGIIGLGRIGTEVAKRAKAFGMKLIAYDPYISQEKALQEGIELVSLTKLLENADFITIHTPLSEETRKLLSYNEFQKMKDGVIIVNCARGGIIDEKSLYEALKSKKVKAAALDVYEDEPPFGSPLLELDNCITIPHLGASTKEAQTNVGIDIAKQVVQALTQGIIENAVNIPLITAELRSILEPYLELAEKIGILHAQLLPAKHIKEINVEYAGEIAHYDTACITVSLLKGLLSGILDEEVINYVNAYALACERGIKINEIRTTKAKDYANSISVNTIFDNKQRVITGVVRENNDLRIVKIDKFSIDAVPSGYLLIVPQTDQPGIIGKIGTILGNLNINIGWLQLSRTGKGQEALSVWNVDSIIPNEALSQIRNLKEVLDAKQVKL